MQMLRRMFPLLLVACLLLSACSAITSPETEAVTDTPPPASEVPAELDTAASEEPASVTQEPVDDEVIIEQPVDECLNCHSDKEMLIATAKPEEEVISENSGEG